MYLQYMPGLNMCRKPTYTTKPLLCLLLDFNPPMPCGTEAVDLIPEQQLSRANAVRCISHEHVSLYRSKIKNFEQANWTSLLFKKQRKEQTQLLFTL